MLKTPVVLFIYKRSSNLEAITKILRQIKPICVYIIADGPKLGDEVECQKTRRRLLDLIDWPCKIHKNYTKNNLGLKDRFRTGIDWVFKHEQRAIFIEDDCIPDSTFFKFCDELLEKYKDDQRMMTISGNNFQFGQKKSSDSYYFSRYPHIWGWATWRRTWMHYDGNIIDWPARRSTNWLKEATHGFIIAKFWKYIFDRLYTEQCTETLPRQLCNISLKALKTNLLFLDRSSQKSPNLALDS